jgi:hypothetical protein
MKVKSFHIEINGYGNAAMEDADQATAKILEDVATGIRAQGLEHMATVIRDENGNTVGYISVYEDY